MSGNYKVVTELQGEAKMLALGVRVTHAHFGAVCECKPVWDGKN